MQDMSWRERGKCWGTRRVDDGTPDPFFPAEPVAYRQCRKADLAMEARAAQLCEGCPVISECLGYALSRSDIFGVWGGTLRRQRTLLRRQMLRARRDEERRSA